MISVEKALMNDIKLRIRIKNLEELLDIYLNKVEELEEEIQRKYQSNIDDLYERLQLG